MLKKERVNQAVSRLEKLYPDAICSLEYDNAFQLLIATRLSAQCTDKRVNIVAPDLFRAFPTPEAMANAELSQVEDLIKTCGLYKTKARDLINIGKMLVSDFGGNIPDNIEDLTKLPGVGRKTANLVCGDIFKKTAVVTDTHFIRICNRLKFVNSTNPLIVEREMIKFLPPEKSSDFCHRTVLFGRDICTARKPKCNECVLNDICPEKKL